MIAKLKMCRDKDFIDWKAFVPFLKSKNSFNFNYEGFRHLNYESNSKYLLDNSYEENKKMSDISTKINAPKGLPPIKRTSKNCE